ncbi:MAG: UvrD-helicase domain-containing protein [Clostridia bacterium]|nr:UvrD-helicase domain-containing protein [Clostridia bacterium]
MEWSDSQKRAIFEQGNLIVSAAAGAGKTTVLTERICSAVISGVPIERFLVLTFTRAAAAEMKQRIQSRLQKAVDECRDEAKRPLLLAQSVAVNSANISTIDSFCTRILHRHGHTIGLDSSVGIADEIQLSVMKDRIRDTFFTALALDRDPDYHRMLSAFRSEDAVWEAIQALSTFLETRPDPDEWLAKTEEEYLLPSYLDRLYDTLLKSMKLDLRGPADRYVSERYALGNDFPKASAIMDDELSRLRALLQMNTYKTYRETALSIEFQRLNFPRDTDPSVKGPVQEARDAVKECLKAQRAVLSVSREDDETRLSESYPLLLSYLSLTRRYRSELTEMKRKQGVMDFSDAEHFALRILSDERIAGEYREKFRYIMIDEYQDSNGVQEALINAIRKPDNLFLVGDIKQSIYRFRSAEPALFLDKIRTYTGSRGERIDLNDNYRSSAEVINAVNAVFQSIMTEPVADMDYDENARLHLKSDNPYGSAEIAAVVTVPDSSKTILDESGTPASLLTDEEQAYLEDVKSAELEARFIAKRIREMIDRVPYRGKDNKEDRPLRYSDFAILLRASTNAQLISEVLAMEGIPCFAQASGGYFDAIEVQILLNCLRVADNRRQDIPLLSVLRSPLFGFTTEELARIRVLEHGQKQFYESFFTLSEREPEGEYASLIGKVQKAVGFLNDLHDMSLTSGPTALLLKIVDETGYYEQTGALPAGQQRLRNIDALIEKAHTFESSGLSGVWRFVRAMEAASKNADVAVPQNSVGDVVRILTIHRSKGLEFPVVFVAQTGTRFNRRDAAKTVNFHSDLGIGLKYEAKHVKYETIVRRAVAEKGLCESVAEEMRVLYVAMTRARQNLILVASVQDREKTELRAGVPLSPTDVKKASCPFLWLLSAAGQKDSDLPLTIVKCEDLLPSAQAVTPGSSEEPDPDYEKKLRESLRYQYPHPEATALPGKSAVSQAARLSGESGSPLFLEHLSFDPPAFLTGNEPTAAMRGTATHRLLERLPFRVTDAESLREEMESLLSSGRLTEEESRMIRMDSVGWYVSSDLWKRAGSSQETHREWNFTVSVPASEVFDTPLTETVLMQGVIDFCFLENGKWVLVDYKTDGLLPDETPESHAEVHRRQLELYSVTLERITGRPVSERYVVLLNSRAAVRLL